MYLFQFLKVLAGHPLAGKERGIHVLGLLKLLSSILHPDVEELWDTVIPKLIQYVEGMRKSVFAIFPGRNPCPGTVIVTLP